MQQAHRNSLLQLLQQIRRRETMSMVVMMGHVQATAGAPVWVRRGEEAIGLCRRMR